MCEGTAELRRLTHSSSLSVDSPAVVVANEDGAVIAVESEWQAVAAEHPFQQAEIAESGFRREELRDQDFAGGVVLHAQSGEARAAPLEPVVSRLSE